MKAQIAFDEKKGAGFAVIEIQEIAPPETVTNLTFTLKTKDKSLGPGGWQPSDCNLMADQVTLDDQRICLFVGPSVVNNLDPMGIYRFAICQAETLLGQCSLIPENIVQSDKESIGHISEYAQKKAEAAKPVPSIQPPQPIATIAPVEASPAGLGSPPATATDSLATEKLPITQAKSSNVMPIVVAVIIVLLAGGGFAIYKLWGAKTPPPAGEIVSTRPIDQARQHLKQNGDPAVGLRLAESMGNEADTADAIFLLVEDAAQKGNSEAMLRLARFYDPLDAAPTGTVQKDMQQAYTWYTKAREAGKQEAEKSLHDLKNWVEQRASSGSAEARELLSRWR